jgi:hypothetical protein
MLLRIQRRAEIALRSLEKLERSQISRALEQLTSTDRASLQSSSKLHKLASGFSGKKLFVYRGSFKLRLILSFEHDTCIIEDVVHHDRLDRLIAKWGQE